MKDFLDAFPACAVHRHPPSDLAWRYLRRNQCVFRISVFSHALAAIQSRSTVRSPTPSTASISLFSSPPKYRSSTSLAWRGLISARVSRAASSRSRSWFDETGTSMDSSSVTKTEPPPRLSAMRRRAASRTIWRMTHAAVLLKCNSDCGGALCDLASFNQVSCTRVNVLIVAFASERFKKAAERCNSEYNTPNQSLSFCRDSASNLGSVDTANGVSGALEGSPPRDFRLGMTFFLLRPRNAKTGTPNCIKGRIGIG